MIYYIYLFRNKINNKTYVGYTSKHWETRCKQHLSSAKSGSDKVLCQAINKYGIENFDIRPIGSAPTLELAKLFEQRMIFVLDSFGPNGYNRTKGGDGSGSHTEEHKEYMSKIMKNRAFSNDTRAKMSRSAKGKPKSDDFKIQVSNKLKNDPNIQKRNRIAGIYSNYLKGNFIKEENLKLIQHLIERKNHVKLESY